MNTRSSLNLGALVRSFRRVLVVSGILTLLWSAGLSSRALAQGADELPPVVTHPVPTAFVDTGSPQTVSGTITDGGSGVDRMELVALDLGAAGATGVSGLKAWNDLDTWVAVADAPVLPVDISGDQWSFSWDPIPGGSGSYVLGLRAFDVAGNKWPADKQWQALVIIGDTSKPSLGAVGSSIVGSTITWQGSASDDTAVRKSRMIIRHVESNEYWNGESWVSRQEAATDPAVLLHSDLDRSLSQTVNWSFSLDPGRAGTFQTLHWAQDGAYQYSVPATGVVTLDVDGPSVIQHSGPIAADENWAAGAVHVVVGVEIQNGATLTIEAGAVVKSSSVYSLDVLDGGVVRVAGSAGDPVVFASVRDDRFGGDTNGDGDATVPDPGAGGLSAGGGIHVRGGGFADVSFAEFHQMGWGIHSQLQSGGAIMTVTNSPV